MRILLTGCEGFIGKSLNTTLMKHPDVTSVVGIEKDYMNYKGWQPALFKAVSLCDVVLHVGAISDTMLKDPNEMMKYNYEFSRELFDIAQINDKPVIYSSSAANTGDNGLPSNIYGWSKYVTEQYGIAKNNFKFIGLRYFNVYGPGESHKGKMASVAHQAHLNGEFKLFDGKPLRDFVYIDDVVDATIYPIFNDVARGVYEVGSGEARSFEDVLELMDIPFEYWHKNNTPKGYQFYTKSSEIKFMSGWKPKYNLENGIKKYKEYLNESM